MKTFKLLTISRNRNSFGLRGAILVAQDGEAWEIACGDLHFPQVGDSYPVPTCSVELLAKLGKVPDDQTAASWSARGWELPRRLPKAPQEAVDFAFRPVVYPQEVQK